MRRIIFLFLFFAVNVKCFTQTNFLFDESKIQIELLNINTEESEFGPYLIEKTLYFASSQERKMGVISMEASTQHQMLDLYSSQLSDDSHGTKSKPLSDNINTPLNQGGCFFDKTTSKLYYSSNIACEGYSKKYKLVIFSSVLQNNIFETPVAEIILPDTFSAAQPCVFEKKLYFSSNMTGGKGKTDIYTAEKVGDAWGNFKNCDFLNSPENEFFPFVISENEIYFSSNRPGGFGKLDLYKYTMADGTGSVIQNLGKPVNSEFDDFAIYVDPLQETGYFSSNRYENQDDIYFYKQTWPTFTNCKETLPEDYCYNLSEENTLDTDRAKGYYYEWLFGDGTKQKGLSVRHCFPGPGSYVINLNIIDSLTKSVFLSQATFDLKVDSIVQLKINCLDTVPTGRTFAINSIGTYLPDNIIEGYYFEIEKLRLRGPSQKHSFSKAGLHQVLFGVTTVNKKTNKKELLCTTKNIVVVEQNIWASIEQRRINEELNKFSYLAFKADTASILKLISSGDIDFYNKLGINGKKAYASIKSMLDARKGKTIVEEPVPSDGHKFGKLSDKNNRVDTLLRLQEGSDMTFKVHFGTSKFIKDTTYLNSKGIIGISEKLINNEYHYTYGNETKLDNIEKYYQRSILAGVKNPVVIGYKNDQMIFDQSANIRPATFLENKFRKKDTTVATTTKIDTPTEPVLKETQEITTNFSNTTKESVATTKTTTVPEEKNEKHNEEIKTQNNTETKTETTVKHEAEKTDVTHSEKLEVTNEKEFNSLSSSLAKMNWFLEKYGDISVQDLEFKVQVGAFRKRKNYEFPKLAGMGKIVNEEMPDCVTRMTIGGSFSKLSEAFNFTKKIINAGQEDAFVSVYYKGKRIYIENLERKGLLGNNSEVSYKLFKNSDVRTETKYSNNTSLNNETTGEFVAQTNIQKKSELYAQKYGTISADGLEFKVQIAVFKYRKNFNFPRLNQFGNIETETLGDGIVRVTVGGSFKTLGEAFELNKKVVKSGQSDAFVSVFYKGKRIYIENLEQKGVFVVNKN